MTQSPPRGLTAQKCGVVTMRENPTVTRAMAIIGDFDAERRIVERCPRQRTAHAQVLPDCPR